MGRRSHSRRLNIWMNGVLVGYWEVSRNSSQLGYFDAWLEDEQGRPLSLSLPFLPGNAICQGPIVTDYFDNLLPDSDAIRRRLARRHSADSTSVFDLLAKLGRDCVGAIQLLPEDEEPSDIYEINGQALNEAGVAAWLRSATAVEGIGHHHDNGDLRISIAGAQEKTAFLLQDGKWCLPTGSTPTTHIFKLPLGLVGQMRADMRTSVENEWLCSKIMEAFKIPVAHCDIGSFEDQKALVVERFDRALASDASWIIRLPQEDMCQAMGISPLHKYQADGGPGIATIMDLLLGSEDASSDRRHFFKTQLIFWLLAAPDGHAKNYSLAILAGGRYRATPIYDILSAHPVIGHGAHQLSPQKAKMAMAVRGRSNHYRFAEIRRRHWIEQAKQIGLAQTEAEQLIKEVLASTMNIIREVEPLIPNDFPTDIAGAIFSGMRDQCSKLEVDR